MEDKTAIAGALGLLLGLVLTFVIMYVETQEKTNILDKQLLTQNFTIQTLNASLQICQTQYVNLDKQAYQAINQSQTRYDNLLAQCQQAIQELQKR